LSTRDVLSLVLMVLMTKEEMVQTNFVIRYSTWPLLYRLDA
jgi:hypothetical protein